MGISRGKIFNGRRGSRRKGRGRRGRRKVSRFSVINMHSPFSERGIIGNLIRVRDPRDSMGPRPFRGQFVSPLKRGSGHPNRVPGLIGVRLGRSFCRRQPLSDDLQPLADLFNIARKVKRRWKRSGRNKIRGKLRFSTSGD